MDPKVSGLIRHIVGALSTLAVSFGLLTEDVAGQVTEALLGIVGSIGVIWAFVASWTAKEKQNT